MLYKVTFKNGTFAIGGALCSENEALEYIARGFTPIDWYRAGRIIEGIKRNSR